MNSAIMNFTYGLVTYVYISVGINLGVQLLNNKIYIYSAFYVMFKISLPTLK